MDRSDEAKHSGSTGEFASGGGQSGREGDVLGLGNSPVPKGPGDPGTEYDAESVRHRRERVTNAAEEDQRSRDLEHGAGATGIDMGAGGGGTDVSGT
jgi:hypothetical protein